MARLTESLREALRSRLVLLVLLPPILFLLLGPPALRHLSFNDHTSGSFDQSRAFVVRGYSNLRQAEAQSFIQKYNDTPTAGNAPTFHRLPTAAAAAKPLICVGVASVVRPSGDIYVRDCLGSLLAGLSQRERDQLHVMPMISHVNATDHPVFTEPWLRRVSDKVLTYSDDVVSEETHRRVEEIELERKRTGIPDREKTIIDYVHVMRQCKAMGAPYIMILEDDVLFLDGWFHRTKAALEEVERQAAPKNPVDPGWFYLRLFWIGKSGNGNHRSTRDTAREWALKGALAVQALVLFVLLGLRFAVPAGLARTFRARAVKNTAPLVVFYACALAGVSLFILAAHHVVPAAEEWAGVREMDACCTQGVVYPARKVDPLTAWYEKNRVGFVDSLSEDLIRSKGKPDGTDIGSRWAVGPVVLQHVGSMSSKGDNWGSDKPGELSASQRIWNLMFERNSPQALAAEHQRVIEAEERT